MTVRLPRFPGLERYRTATERGAFVRKVAEAGFDPAAVAAVIEIETAGKWAPGIHGPVVFSQAPGYPVGLIQFAPSTAESLGTTSVELERMTFLEQLPYVLKYYQKWGGPSAFSRPGDYYLAGWGANPRTADDTVLARAGSAVYKGNPLLDLDKDGMISARELRALIDQRIKSAESRGVWEYENMVPSISVGVQNPQGEAIGTASVSDAMAPGTMALVQIYGTPVMVAYPNGWRFLQFAPGVLIPAVSGHPYEPLPETKPPSFGLVHAGLVLGIAGLAATIFYGTLQAKPRRAAA